MKIGLFFGSFNPIHLGHLNVAQYVLNECDLDRVVFIVTPQNPFKTDKELWPAEKRYNLISKAIADNPRLEVSDIEFGLPTPSYTSQTLEAIEQQKDGHSYFLIMGSDTLAGVGKWQNPEKILSYPILVYPRSSKDKNPYPDRKNILEMDCPILEISASQIRQNLNVGKSVKYQVPDSILTLL